MIVVIKDIDKLFDINKEIEEVFKSHTEWSMISPAFAVNAYLNLLKNKKCRLYFVLSKHEEKIESYVPLYIDDNGTLRFILDNHTDYCGIIGKEVDGKFLKEFAKLIQSETEIKRIDLDNLPLNDQLLNGLRYHLKLGMCMSSYNSHSYIFSDKERGYFGTLKGKDRSELKRVSKKNNNTQFVKFSYPDPFPKNEIVVLRDKMVSNKWRDESYFDNSFLQFAIALYEANELIIISNFKEDEMVSVVFTFQNSTKNSFIFWITLYDQKVQYINLTSYLNFISSNEFKDNYYYSFARGDYSFKTTFSPITENLYNLRYSKSKWDFYFTNYYPIKEFVKRIVKSKQ